MTPLETMRNALAALKLVADNGYSNLWLAQNGQPAISNLRSAIEEMEKANPVAWLDDHDSDNINLIPPKYITEYGRKNCKPLYTNPPIPEGWQLVPIEPTEDMLDAAKRSGATGGDIDISNDYKAMLVAAPKPENV